MFSFGIPSSCSVYTLFFLFFVPIPLLFVLLTDFVFCRFGGGSLVFFATRLFETSEGFRVPPLLRRPPLAGLEDPLLGAILCLVCLESSDLAKSDTIDTARCQAEFSELY